MTKVLIITEDYVDSNMGGVGMRYWEFAHALSKHCRVTLAIPNVTDLQSDRVNLVSFELKTGDIRSLAQAADVILTHGFVLHFHPYLVELAIPLVVDLYNPYLLENLVMYSEGDLENWLPAYEEYMRVQLEMLRFGDYFICGNERQRDYWLGWLHAQKRLNPHTYRDDPGFRNLIDIVPSGIQNDRPNQNKPVLRGVIPGISPGDRIVLWSGGVWDWLDPLTPIRAMALLAPRYPDLKLYFLGTRHPNPVVPDMVMVEKAIELSRELGLYEKSVFFGSWVPYQERENYLVEADLAVLAHQGHIETHFSFRTRLLDCIWAGLPIVVTGGDAMADWVKEHNIGVVVPEFDDMLMAEAIEKVIWQTELSVYSQAFEHLRANLAWDKVIQPLLAFCLTPKFAPDKGLYLTELERISRDKDAYISKIIEDKDDYVDQIIQDKDAYINQVILDKDAFIAQMTYDWEAHLERVLKDRADEYERLSQDKDSKLSQVTGQLEQVLESEASARNTIRELDTQHREKEREYQMTMADLNQALDEKENQYQIALSQLQKYRNLLPFRMYRAVKRFFNR